MKFIKYGENKLTVTRYVQNVHHWHEHKHASVLSIGQLRINQRLLEASPHMQQTLSQLINAMNVTVTSYLRRM